MHSLSIFLSFKLLVLGWSASCLQDGLVSARIQQGDANILVHIDMIVNMESISPIPPNPKGALLWRP